MTQDLWFMISIVHLLNKLFFLDFSFSFGLYAGVLKLIQLATFDFY